MSRNRARPRNNTGGDQPRRALPGLALAGRLAATAGPRERYAGQDDAAVMLAAGRWDAMESWVYGRKLAAARELVRRRPAAGAVTRIPGGVPSVWRKDLGAEIALELAVTTHAAETLAGLAVVLETRLPLTAAALDAGILNASKARLIADETAVLTDEQARAAEAEIAGKWEGQAWPRIRDLITRAVVNADPEAAVRRREQAEREDARVRFFRDQAGTCGLAGYSLPPDEALRAMQAISGRARAYRAWGIDGTMEQLRVLAYLDLLTGRDARTRCPKSAPAPARKTRPGTPHGGGRRGHGTNGTGRGADAASQGGDSVGRDENAANDDQASAGRDEDDWYSLLGSGPADDADDDAGDRDDEDSDDDGHADGDDGADGNGPGNGGDGRGPAGPAGPAAGCDGLAANVDLIIPLADLTRYAQRAGLAPALGTLDPDLARRLAGQAARNPASSFRIIVTDPEGHAVGFGQAGKRRPGAATPPSPNPGPAGQPPDNPAMPLARFIPAGTGPDGGYGTWKLEIGGTAFRVRLHQIPDGGENCDHRYESAGYQPSPTLRRLVQVRDGECAMPGCARTPRSSEWEHAIPWPHGRTCSCNGGLHCKRDHLIKQDPRWGIVQNADGTRTWTTPAGLTYTKPRKQYPT